MVDMKAPDPVTTTPVAQSGDTTQVVTPNGPDQKNPSVVKVTIAGCGGCGMNLSRLANGFIDKNNPSVNTFFFDTSMTNSRGGERVYVIGDGSGSGSHRSENARTIEQKVATLTEDELGASDVAVVVFSAAGGTGSVIGPVMIREYVRRLGMRVIAVVVSDNSSTTGAKNTINTLKTLTAIATNANLYLPIVVLSNDQQAGRRGADKAAALIINDIVDLLTTSVFEVDRNDRLNFIDPSKVIGAKPGLKLLQVISDQAPTDPAIVVGVDSEEMVDSLLIVQNADEESLPGVSMPMSRLKKAGFFYESHRAVVGKVTGDITAVNDIIDSVERIQQVDKSSRYDTVDRLSTNGDNDLIL